MVLGGLVVGLLGGVSGVLDFVEGLGGEVLLVVFIVYCVCFGCVCWWVSGGDGFVGVWECVLV